MDRRIERFDGEICGLGTSSGHRLVIGRWVASPFGAFADVMHEGPEGLRTLFAPTEAIADYVRATYVFDTVVVGPVVADRDPGSLRLTAGPFELDVEIGQRTGLGRLLRTVPRPLARSRAWCSVIDPIARVALRGVRTRGTAGGGRIEYYGATDQHAIAAVHGVRDGQDLGGLADVWPPVRFGFSSTPRTPGIVAVTTTISSAVATDPGSTPERGRRR